METYRQGNRACASCRSPMRAHLLPHAGSTVEVERCDGCGSVFLDFEDGDPGAVSRAIEKAGVFKPAVARQAQACPGCRSPLALLPYLDAGPPIYRCGACAGAFLTPAQQAAIGDFELVEKAGDDSLWRALIRWIRGD